MAFNPDKNFISAIKSGDSKRIDSAFRDVYTSYSKLVAFVVGEYISDRETIKEVVNDVFVSLFNHAATVKGSVKYYLAVSAKNAAINRAKKEERSRADLPIEFADRSVAFEPRSDLIELIERAVGKREAEIILMHAVEGYSFIEIAKKLKINKNTVSTIYFRTIKKLKKEVGEDE